MASKKQLKERIAQLEAECESLKSSFDRLRIRHDKQYDRSLSIARMSRDIVNAITHLRKTNELFDEMIKSIISENPFELHECPICWRCNQLIDITSKWYLDRKLKPGHCESCAFVMRKQAQQALNNQSLI